MCVNGYDEIRRILFLIAVMEILRRHKHPDHKWSALLHFITPLYKC